MTRLLTAPDSLPLEKIPPVQKTSAKRGSNGKRGEFVQVEDTAAVR